MKETALLTSLLHLLNGNTVKLSEKMKNYMSLYDLILQKMVNYIYIPFNRCALYYMIIQKCVDPLMTVVELILLTFMMLQN
jgi:hypothetical protein